jgi:hypothetical protein
MLGMVITNEQKSNRVLDVLFGESKASTLNTRLKMLANTSLDKSG